MEQQYAYPDIEIQNLLKGLPPGKSELLKSLSTGLDSLTEFLTDQYLQEYIPSGGSKIKFVTGRPGSGKTHLGLRLIQEARDRNYLTVSFSAKEVWLHDFREIYLELFRQCGIERILEGCAGQIVKELGYDPGQIRPGQNFMDFLSERNEADAIARGEIRGALRRFFTRNPLLDNTFACCCSLLTGSILGHPVLEQGNKELILAYMSGDKTVRLSQLRALGLSPSRITKYNARNLLRSLAETAKLGGFAGIIVVITDHTETRIITAWHASSTEVKAGLARQ